MPVVMLFPQALLCFGPVPHRVTYTNSFAPNDA